MRTVVGVVRGGASPLYEESLRSGAAVLGALERERYEPRDIFVDRQGAWHLYGAPVEPSRALFGADVAFNALHGRWGGEAPIQNLLSELAVPHTGSGAFVSALASDAGRTKEAARRLGLKVPRSMLVHRPARVEELAYELFRAFPQPAVVVPHGGMPTVADSYHALEQALQNGFVLGPEVVLEEHIHGRQAEVGVLDNFRGEHPYALIPEPADLSAGEKEEVARLAKRLHEGLGLAHYSHARFVVSRRGTYFAGVATHPPLHEESVFNRALGAVGVKLRDFLHHVISLATRR